MGMKYKTMEIEQKLRSWIYILIKEERSDDC